MKHIVFIGILCLYVISTNLKAQSTDILTNNSIINMSSKHLPVSIILGKIKVEKNTFNVGTDSLIQLSESKISEEIINAMIEAAADNNRHLVAFDPNNPLDMHECGIYYYDNIENKKEMTALEASLYSQNKSSGVLASALTYGVAKVKTSVTLDGNAAHFQIRNNHPIFYFYFDLSGKPLSETSNWWFSVATSPNEFLLVTLHENKKTREVVTGSANVSGSTIGVDDKNKAVFKVEKISQGVYKVYFDNFLIDGEYCFMYAGNIPSGFTMTNKVYDFGLHTNQKL
jgi:hypothetical protein